MLVVPAWGSRRSLTGLEWFWVVGVEAAFFAATDAAMGPEAFKNEFGSGTAAADFCVGDAEAVDVESRSLMLASCW